MPCICCRTGPLHGLQLGSTWLDAQTINGYAEVIRGWEGAFSTNGDLLLYGCDLAASDAGRALVDTLGQWTGTDVAASTDLTGYALFGGDWDLEYRTGSIETEDAADLDTQHDWVGLMSVAVDATSTGSGNNVTSVTVSHTTTSASDRLMLVGVSMDSTGGRTVTECDLWRTEPDFGRCPSRWGQSGAGRNLALDQPCLRDGECGCQPEWEDGRGQCRRNDVHGCGSNHSPGHFCVRHRNDRFADRQRHFRRGRVGVRRGRVGRMRRH